MVVVPARRPPLTPILRPPPPPKPPHPDESLFSFPKMKLPIFEGIVSRGWITKIEHYFQFHITPLNQKLCMDGDALHWYTNLLIHHPNTSSEKFRTKLLNRFSGKKFHNAHEAVGSLFQENDVEEYIVDYESLSAVIRNQPKEQSIGWFLRGLKPEIRNWVCTLNMSSCDKAM